MQGCGGSFTRRLAGGRILVSHSLLERSKNIRPRRQNQIHAAEGAVIGIDLGTSNSAVAVIKDGTPIIIPVEGGRHTLPSVISLGSVRSIKLHIVGCCQHHSLNAWM
jgi:hypothetical protein